MRHSEHGQVQVIEAIIVGILVFVAVALAALFRVPTLAGTFEQSELERLGTDVLQHLAAGLPKQDADCNEAGFVCPFESELDRMISLALRYQGPHLSPTPEPRDITPLADYFNQSLPDGARYVISYSNGVNATRIFPHTLTPPALDVVVAHTLITPNWMQFSDQAARSTLIQIGEVTGFVTASTDSIRDPLNRDREEWGPNGGRSYVSLMSSVGGDAAVPAAAVYGTYKFCRDAACAVPSYFTVVPPGVYGAGSSILLADRDNSTKLTVSGKLLPDGVELGLLRFQDIANPADNRLDPTDPLYLDLDGSATVNKGDLRLSDVGSCPGCLAGTFVKDDPLPADYGQGLEKFEVNHRPSVRAVRDAVNPLILEAGEFLYLDVPDPTAIAPAIGDEQVSENDRRLSRVGTFGMGSRVALADFDHGRPLTQAANDFSAATVYYADTNDNNLRDPEEPIYLDLVGNGQSAGLETLDLRLSPQGSANLRYTYDIQVVVWFGI